MEKCYYSKKHRTGRNLCILTSPILALGFLIIALVLLLPHGSMKPAPRFIVLGIVVLLFDIAFCLYQTLYIRWLDRDFGLDSDGIRIRYPGGVERAISWDEVSHVCLWETHHGAEKPDLVIWCTVGQGQRKPPHMPFFADSFEYEFLHSHTVFSVEFTEERLKAFTTNYKQVIPDFSIKCRD